VKIEQQLLPRPVAETKGITEQHENELQDHHDKRKPRRSASYAFIDGVDYPREAFHHLAVLIVQQTGAGIGQL
jgi:hypothetical protein